MREFTVVIERDEDGWLVGSVPALRGCHTQAGNMEELLENIREAILLCLEVEEDDAAESLTLVGVHRVTV
ncbi:MAG: type II toxin-antitoxin system HicB family antitoxin [Chloroflexi bacterium]|nr:type II toxin-antitoxin system HicB family antitoxin [Chloroflexota bacterium]